MTKKLTPDYIVEYSKLPLPENCVKPFAFADDIYPFTNETASLKLILLPFLKAKRF